MLHFLASHVRTQDSAYIHITETYARKILQRSIEKNGARYFPFPFDWKLGGCSLTMAAPWISGMSQGQMLSALIRLYEKTRKPDYLEACRQIMRNFQRLQDQNDPWVVTIDASR